MHSVVGLEGALQHINTHSNSTLEPHVPLIATNGQRKDGNRMRLHIFALNLPYMTMSYIIKYDRLLFQPLFAMVEWIKLWTDETRTDERLCGQHKTHQPVYAQQTFNEIDLFQLMVFDA